MICPDCRGQVEMDLIKQCCDDTDKFGRCRTTHFMLEKPYWKCPVCKIEVEDETQSN